jgi:hypothetical protein
VALQRPWAVRPDQQDGSLSREGLIAALVDAATMLDIAGGCLEVVVGRAPTDVPGEMVMTGAMLCWRDKTDGKPQREASVQVTPEPEPQRLETEMREALADGDEGEIERVGEEIGKTWGGSGDTEPADAKVDPDDGFNYGAMPDEDVEDAPVAARV